METEDKIIVALIIVILLLTAVAFIVTGTGMSFNTQKEPVLNKTSTNFTNNTTANLTTYDIDEVINDGSSGSSGSSYSYDYNYDYDSGGYYPSPDDGGGSDVEPTPSPDDGGGDDGGGQPETSE